MCVFTYDVGIAYGHAGNIPGYASNSVYFPGHGNDFALSVVAGDTEADVVAAGINLLATAVRASVDRASEGFHKLADGFGYGGPRRGEDGAVAG